MLPKTNSRGFNLFSALVAAVLIMAGVLLVNTMTFRESSTRNQIYSMKENFGLADAANIARADALQTFSHYFRKELEDYLAFDEDNPNYFTLLTINENAEPNFEDWNRVVQTFERSILLEPDADSPGQKKYEAVVNFVAQNMVDNFQWAQKGSYGRYRVRLSEEDVYLAQAKIKAGVANAIENTIAEPDASLQDFFEIVDCTEEECPLGTFYFNIPLDRMSQEDYENLPRIVVTDTHTGEEIKIPLLPKEKLRIYIPLRFLKAVHEARNYALAYNNYGGIGLNEIFREYRLGFCDERCAPRNDPATAVSGDRTSNYCPSTEIDDASKEPIEGPAKDRSLLENYPSGGGNPGTLELQKSVIAKLRESLGAVGTPSGDFINEMTRRPYDLPRDYYATSYPRIWEEFPFKEVIVQRNSYTTKNVFLPSGDDIGAPLRCTQALSVEIKMLFREENRQYVVNGKESNGENVYGIKFFDEHFTKQNDISGQYCTSDPSGGTCKSGAS